jgi:hypothetical protein
MTRDSRQDKLQFKEINNCCEKIRIGLGRLKRWQKTAGHKIILNNFSFTKINAHLNR